MFDNTAEIKKEKELEEERIIKKPKKKKQAFIVTNVSSLYVFYKDKDGNLARIPKIDGIKKGDEITI